MKIFYLLFFIFLLLIISFFLIYKFYYDKYLNNRINNKCFKKKLLPPYKLFKYSVSTVGILLITLISVTFINLNDNNFIKKYDKVIVTEMISGQEKVLLNFEVYDLKENNNKYYFKIEKNEEFKNYLNTFDSFYHINNKYYVLFEENYYLIEYEIKNELSDYMLTPLYFVINDYNKDKKDYLPTIPCEGNLYIDCHDSSLIEFRPLINISWDEYKSLYDSLNYNVTLDEENKTIMINNELFIEKYLIFYTEELITFKIGEKSYKITYDLQGGYYDNCNTVITKTYYNSRPDLITPTKENYEFIGWARSLCTDYDSLISSEYNYSTDIVLFAKWKSISNIRDKSYNVKFIYNFEKLEENNYETFTNKILVLPKPSLDFKYEFFGWYTNLDDESTKFTEESIISSDLVLYAKILPRRKINITLDSGEGSFYDDKLNKYVNALEIDIYIESYDLGHIDILEPLGHSFVGWELDGRLIPENYVFTKDVTLKAHYKKNLYTISFITHTDEEIEPIQFIYGQKISFDYDLRREGYEFVKWDIFENHSTMPAYDLVATAIWKSNDGINYVLNEEKTGYIVDGVNNINDKLETLIIREEFLGLPVLEIKEYAFLDNGNLKKVFIPDSIIKIGTGAFERCYNLEFVKLSENLQILCSNAFKNTTSLSEIIIPKSIIEMGKSIFESSGLQNVILEDGVTILGSSMFSKCNRLKNITIPKSINKIGNCVFESSGLESINIEEGVSVLGEQMFLYCKKLKEIYIPKTIIEIGTSTFQSSGLESIIIEEGVETISSLMFYRCVNLKSINLPNSIKIIGGNAFKNSSITKVNFPEKLEYIGESAFAYMSDFVDITLSNNVKYIGKSAFANCINLQSIKLSKSLETLDDYAFNNCSLLTDIVLPDGIITIGEGAFLNCDKLTKINIPSSVKEIRANAMPKNMLYNVKNNLLVIDNWVFGVYNKQTNKIIVTEEYHGIVAEAFSNCKSVQEIFILENVKYIGSLAFWNVPESCKIYIESKFSELTVEENWNLINIKLMNNSYLQNIYIYPTFDIDIIINNN